MYNTEIKPARFLSSPSDREYLPSVFSSQLPRYLFRVHKPKSIGEASPGRIAPSTPTDDKNHLFNIFKEDPKQAAAVLRNHLLWDENIRTCNLMSWTSSLLVALLYGIYLNEHERIGYPSIKLLVVDTQELTQDGIFAKDMELIQFFVQHDETVGDGSLSALRKLRRGDYNFGEYLSLDEVLPTPTRCVETDFEKITKSGLTTLYPWLTNKTLEGKWAKRVVNARKKYLTGSLAPALLSRELVQNTMEMTRRLFGDDWTFPMSAMILGLRRVQDLSKAIVDTFTSYVSKDQMRAAFSLSDLEGDLDALPEIQSYQLILRDIVSDRKDTLELSMQLEAMKLKDEQAETALAAETV